MKLFVRKSENVSGCVNISGAKNSAVAIIPAAILTNKKVILSNIPDITDVSHLIKILNNQGFKTKFENNTLEIKRRLFIKKKFTKEIDNLRGSYYFIGAFLAKFKKIKFGEYGGCKLGDRPINFHLNGFKKMNVEITNKKNFLCFKTKKIKGTTLTLPFQSVGATINLMLASVKNSSITTIENSSQEPEVVDVGNFLKTMGAKIYGLGTKTITIKGVKKLNGCHYKIISDRIEAATYLAIGAVTSTNGVTIKNINYSSLSLIIYYLKKIGCKFNFGEDYITIFKPTQLKPIEVTTGPYPFFPTDLNPIFSAILLKANGISKITETIYKDRTSHINEFKKLNADITLSDSTTLINKSELINASLKAHDLRCAASLIIAGLQTNSDFIIEDIDYLLRGYENPVKKLSGINITSKIIN